LRPEGSDLSTLLFEVQMVHRTRRSAMARKVADCRDMPSEVGCTLTISGEEEEVVAAAAQHAVAVHGHTDGPELREQIRSMLKEEAHA
jgi:predicted small metal-binding protein